MSFTQPQFLPSSHQYPSLWRERDATDVPQILHVKSNLSQILRMKTVRVINATVAIIFLVVTFIFVHYESFDFHYLTQETSNSAIPPAAFPTDDVDWSRYAYTQYVTDTDYLCNSVLLFETLHRLGSKADRLMMFPANFQDKSAETIEGRLLLKAKDEYGVKLMPVEVQHKSGDPTWADSYTKLLAFNQTQYKRVLSLDSDSTVLQPMDELFLLPSSPVAMPRAYWLDKPFLSSQLVLIQPSLEEFARIENAIKSAKESDYDMGIVNDLYGKDCMVIPHRRYNLLTGEFRSEQHRDYLGNDYETWDPEVVLGEAKFLHFSDWPMPKPWLSASQDVVDDVKPKCDQDSAGEEDCRARDMWLGFYNDFNERKKSVCGPTGTSEVKRGGRFERRDAWDAQPKEWKGIKWWYECTKT